MRARRTALVSLVMATIYVAVAALTGALSSHPVRPLFDGFNSETSETPYRWVNPPPEARAGNRKPGSFPAAEVRLTKSGSRDTSFVTPEAQANLLLGAGAIGPHPPDRRAAITMTPVDPGTLSPLPGGLHPESNAYRIAISYRPSGDEVGVLRETIVSLTAGGKPSAFLHSADGRSWRRVRSLTPSGTPHLNARITAPGYVVLAGTAPPETEGDGGEPDALLVAGAILISLLTLGLIPLVARRARRSRP